MSCTSSVSVKTCSTFLSPEAMNVLTESVKAITWSCKKKCLGCLLLKPLGHFFLIRAPCFFLKTYCRLFPWAWLLLSWDKGRGAVEFRTDKTHHTSISQRVLSSLRQPATVVVGYPDAAISCFSWKRWRLSSKRWTAEAFKNVMFYSGLVWNCSLLSEP